MKRILTLLLILALIQPIITYAAVGDIKELKDVPIGDIVYDPSWTWEHRTGSGYTGGGTVKPVEWIIVAKNHYKNSTTGTVTGDHVTLLTKETIAKYCFDDSTNRGSPYGSNHWGDI